ncbi:hypothetical protein CR513_36200, partial [Mucuna pruriens]
MWVNQTTSNKENVVEHPSTSQIDQDIQAFNKQEMDHLQALLFLITCEFCPWPWHFHGFFESYHEDKVIILGPNELPNLVGHFRLDDRNYLQWAQYIRTTLKSGPPRDDPKFEARNDEDFLIMT